MVARAEIGNAGANSANDAGTLMTKHFRELRGIIGVAAVQIGRAHAGGNDFDQKFVRPRIAQIESLDQKGTRTLANNGGGNLHG